METTLKHGMSQTQTKNEIWGGIVTGQVAGLIMAVVIMIVFTVFLGKGPLFPVQVIGSTLVGPEALNGFNITALIVGLLLHQLGPSLLWGVVYGFLAHKFNISNSKNALLLGLGVAVISMVGPYFLIPFVMKTMNGVDFWAQEVPMVWDWAAHLVFGASFFLYPAIMNKLNSK